MKYLFGLCALLLLLATVSCTNDADTTTIPEIKNPGVKGKINNPNKGKAAASSSSVVESERRVADPTYADGSVNYEVLAAEICACSSESNRLNLQMETLANEKKSKEFASMAPKLNEAFKAAVKCSEGKVESVKTEFSPYKLVPQMKQQCGELPQELVAQILRSFGVNI